MSLRQTFKTNKEAEVQGVWVDVGYSEAFNGPVQFKVARMSAANKQYSAALERAQRPHLAQINAGTMNTDLGNKIFREVFIDHILKDWRNVSKGDLTGQADDYSEQLAFTPENANKLFDELPDVYHILYGKAGEVAEFTEARQQDAGKN
jgi:hypothetical protein